MRAAGFLVVAAALVIALPRSISHAQEDAPAKDATSTVTYVGSDACKACHGALNENLAAAGHGDALFAEGLPGGLAGCEACHGPGSAHLETRSKGDILGPSEFDSESLTQTCGKCHFESRRSAAPSAWKNLVRKHWDRGLHAGGDIHCGKCHSSHSPNGDKDLTAKDAADLCRTCHQDEFGAGGYAHAPAMAGECLLCHDPHGARARHNVLPGALSTCVDCHDTADGDLIGSHSGYKVAGSNCLLCHDMHTAEAGASLLAADKHGPFESGACTSCHKQGEAPGAEPELTAPKGEVCFGCHTREDVLKHEGSAHKPVEEGLCALCHNPHSSKYEGPYLVDALQYTCFACHEQIEDATYEEYDHEPVKNGKCLTCHQAHSGQVEGLLVKDSTALCTGCHADQTPERSHPVGPETANPQASRFPVRAEVKGQVVHCYSCHAVHGGPLKTLMADTQPTLCTKCHPF